MSLNDKLLMAAAAARRSRHGSATIGVPGELGFGVGTYAGPDSTLSAMGLSPMDGYDDVNSENYGAYIHTNGSVMAFIPAFAMRVGNSSSPNYSKYGADTIEIGDVSLAGSDGWAIPRGFYDGGELQAGFFIDKYLCSKDSTGQIAVSVKNKDPISLTTSSGYQESKTMPNCVGQILDAIELSRARGEHYALVSCYQWAVISFITQAHAQAATSADACAWYDAAGQKNYPKGNNNGSYKDTDDSSIAFTNATYGGGYTKTGSAVPLAKTTHNGQLSGICDVNGNKWQPVLGWQNPSSKKVKLAKLSVKMHDFTKDNRNNNELFDDVAINAGDGTYYWQKGKALYQDTTGSGWAMNGVLPKTLSGTSADVLYGKDYAYLNYTSDRVLLVAGSYNDGGDAGVWCRNGVYYWVDNGDYYSFRAAAYAPL